MVTQGRIERLERRVRQGGSFDPDSTAGLSDTERENAIVEGLARLELSGDLVCCAGRYTGTSERTAAIAELLNTAQARREKGERL